MRSKLIAAALAAALVTGCGGEPRSTTELSDALLTVSDLHGAWTENRQRPDSPDSTMPATGIIPDDQRDMLPTIELCDAASAAGRSAAESLKWDVFRQFDMTPADPFDPPTDREGHKIFLQEFMLSNDASDLVKVTADLFPAMEACLGDIPAGEEGPGTATKINISSGADEQIAVLTQIEEAGGGGQWFIYNAIVRKSSVLMWVMLGDVFIGDLQPEVGLTDFDAIVQAAVEKL